MSDTQKPVSARRLETQERLMDAAFGVCVELGLSDASVEAICAAAGFSRGAFYSNFSSKEELFFALLAREYRRRTEDIEARIAGFGDDLTGHIGGIGRVEAEAFIREFFDASSLDIDWYVIEQEFLLLALRDPELAPDYLKYQAEFEADLAAVVAQIVMFAGRHFVIPAGEAVGVLSSIYERALRGSILASPDEVSRVPGGLGEQMVNALFALTEVSA